MRRTVARTRTTDHRAAVRALEAFGDTAFASNPCRRANATVVWRRDGAASAAELIASFAVVRDPIDPMLIEGRADPEGIVRYPSDWYFCVGAATLGSGRAVIIDGRQVKGIGRTVQAPLVGNELMTDGRVREYKAVDELVRGLLAERLFTVPTIPTLAILRLEDAAGPDSFLVVRESVPLRLTHLMYLAGAAHRMLPVRRMAAWRILFNRALIGRDGFALTESQILRAFDAIIDHAIVSLAEARLFGVFLANWGDNAELGSRLFDFEDITFHFGKPVQWPSGWPLRQPGEAAAEFFTRQDFFGDHDNISWCALAFVANALAVIGLLADGIGFARDVALRRYGWRALESRYERAVGRTLARLCDVTGRDAVEAAARRTVRALPLAPRDGVPTFSPADVLDAFATIASGAKQPSGSTGAIAAELVRARRRSSPLQALAERAGRVRSQLDGPTLTGWARAFRAPAQDIAQQATATRSSAYRELFERIAREAAALELPTS